MSTEMDDAIKTRAATLVARRVGIRDTGGTLGDWNDGFAALVANVSSRLRTKFGTGEQGLLSSAAASAVSTVLKRLDGAAEREPITLWPVGPEALLGLLVLIAFDKVYEKKRRDVDEQDPIQEIDKRGRDDQQHLVSEAIRDEMDYQLEVMLNRLRLLGGGPEALVYKVLLEKEFGINDLDYQNIPGQTGVSSYMVDKARIALNIYGAGLRAEASRAVRGIARRLFQGS
jgi:hypothetical protein